MPVGARIGVGGSIAKDELQVLQRLGHGYVEQRAHGILVVGRHPGLGYAVGLGETQGQVVVDLVHELHLPGHQAFGLEDHIAAHHVLYEFAKALI